MQVDFRKKIAKCKADTRIYSQLYTIPIAVVNHQTGGSLIAKHFLRQTGLLTNLEAKLIDIEAIYFFSLA